MAEDFLDKDAFADIIASLETLKTQVEGYVSDSETWAEGDDTAVGGLGGEHSSKGWADISKNHSREGLRFDGVVPTEADLPANPNNGDAYLIEDVRLAAVYTGSDWFMFPLGANVIAGVKVADFTVDATEGQTVIDVVYDPTLPPDIHVNGSILNLGDDYTATDGTQVTLAQPLTVDDTVKVTRFAAAFDGINQQTEDTNPQSDYNFVAQKPDDSIVKVPYSAFGGLTARSRVFMADQPRLVAFDSFNQADGPRTNLDSGQAWTADTVQVENNEGLTVNPGIPPHGIALVNLPGIETPTIYCDVAHYNNLTSGIVLSFTDNDNYFYVGPSLNFVRIWKKVGGAFSVLDEQSAPREIYYHNVMVSYDPTDALITAHFPGAATLSATLSAGDQTVFEGGRENIGLRGPTDNRYKNFRVYDMTL